MKIHKIFTTILLLIHLTGFGQSVPVNTQYMFNETAYNPAYTGVPERLSATALYRSQWVGVNGAPTTQTLAIHSPVNSESLALGLQFNRDVIGVSARTEVQALYAYRIRFNDDAKLSFGLQTGIRSYNEAFSKLYGQTGDLSFSENIRQSKFIFGTGLYYHTSKFYLGASIPTLDVKRGSKNHYFLTSGYVLTINPQIKFKPNIMVRMADNVPLTYDLNANVLLHEIIWFGASYRSNESLGFLTQLQLTEQLSLAYAFDLPIAGVSNTSHGSHEILLGYKFRLPYVAYKCPRYF